MLLPHVLIASAPRAYRFCPACLSLVAIELIARGPSAYRLWANNLRNLRYLREIKYYREK